MSIPVIQPEDNDIFSFRFIFSTARRYWLWILAAASFLEKTGISAVRITESLHLVYIAGWTFLVAGMIVLVVILRGSRM